MNKRYLTGLLIVAIIATATLLLRPEGGWQHSDASTGERDLDEIRKDTLRVLLIQHPLTYERSPGVETGLEYELHERMAKHLHLRIKAVLVTRRDSLLPMLLRGEGDVIAAQLGKSPSPDHSIAYTKAYRYVMPVFATLRADPALGISGCTDDGPDTAWVAASSFFAPAAMRFPGNAGAVDPHARTVFTDTSRFGDNAVINVALGHTRGAMISDAEAVYFGNRFPQLDFSEPTDGSAPLVFGVRPGSRDLLRALNERISDPAEKEAMAILMSTYGLRIPRHGPLGQISSKIDSIPATAARASAQADGQKPDWKLLAAIATKESREDDVIGADRGDGENDDEQQPIEEPLDPDSLRLAGAQIDATAHYLAELDSVWKHTVPDPDQRLRFVIAVYFTGPGHVQDARILAVRQGLDIQRWEGNVERAITLLALPRFFGIPEVENGPCQGDRAFSNVREVMDRYDRYHGTLLPKDAVARNSAR